LQTDPLKEKLRLRWRLWSVMGRPREEWHYRRQLWVATFWFWLAELQVRICLLRYCVSIYRREVAHRREETALMKLDFWEDRCAEERDW